MVHALLAFLFMLSVPSASAEEAINVFVEPASGSADQLVVQADGLAPGDAYVARLYAGSPKAPSASFGQLGQLIGDATGHEELRVSLVVSSHGETVLTQESLTDGNHFVALVHPDAGIVASAALPPVQHVVVELQQSPGSTVAGSATLMRQQDGALLELLLDGAKPRVAYQARLYAGSPSAPSASFGLLGTLVADASGTARLETDGVHASAAGVLLDLNWELLNDGEHFIAIVEPDQGVVATGLLPRTDQPRTGGQPELDGVAAHASCA